jgi:hypothetical protein
VNENLNDVLSAKLTMEEELLEKNKLLQTQLHEVCVTYLLLIFSFNSLSQGCAKWALAEIQFLHYRSR